MPQIMMTNFDVIEKLIGPISPVGETNEDNRRFENLKEMTILIDKLLFDIHIVAMMNERSEFSIQRAGKYASKFLGDVRDAE